MNLLLLIFLCWISGSQVQKLFNLFWYDDTIQYIIVVDVTGCHGEQILAISATFMILIYDFWQNLGGVYNKNFIDKKGSVGQWMMNHMF